MAKHGKRKFRRYVAGSINTSNVLGTLASADLISVAAGDTVAERTYMTSIRCSWSIRGLTAGEGPIFFGVAHSDYTDAEIEEFLENAGSWSEGDLVQKEVGGRKIRRIGSFSGNDTEEAYADGRQVLTKCGWILNTGQNVKFYAFNKFGSALTTGAVIIGNGKANLWPTG